MVNDRNGQPSGTGPEPGVPELSEHDLKHVRSYEEKTQVLRDSPRRRGTPRESEMKMTSVAPYKRRDGWGEMRAMRVELAELARRAREVAAMLCDEASTLEFYTGTDNAHRFLRVVEKLVQLYMAASELTNPLLDEGDGYDDYLEERENEARSLTEELSDLGVDVTLDLPHTGVRE
jgi:hypothetical protein